MRSTPSPAPSQGATRLTVLLSHPVQYYAPIWRHLNSHHAELSLTVLYVTSPLPRQQGAAFGVEFTWDEPLREGYSSLLLRSPLPRDDYHRFTGLRVSGLRRSISATRPDVVLIPGWQFAALVRGVLACKMLRLPVLYRGDTSLLSAPTGWRRGPWEVRTRAMLSLYDGYLAVGSRAREYLAHFGARSARVVSSPHCVDVDYFRESAAPHQSPAAREAARARFGVENDEFVVLWVGKLDENKRPSHALQAVAKLEPGARLVVVGSGPLEQECRDEAAFLGVSVFWGGFINQSALGEAYAAADVLVVSSRGETWGLVVNEALATGLPCVTSDVVGCADDLIRSDWTGETYPGGDIDALAHALARVRNRLAAGHSYAEGCREVSERHSLCAASVGISAAARAFRRRR